MSAASGLLLQLLWGRVKSALQQPAAAAGEDDDDATPRCTSRRSMVWGSLPVLWMVWSQYPNDDEVRPIEVRNPSVPLPAHHRLRYNPIQPMESDRSIDQNKD